MTLTQGAVPQIPRPDGATVCPVGRRRSSYAVMLFYRDAAEAQKALATITRLTPPEQP